MTKINPFPTNTGLQASTTGAIGEYTTALALIRYSGGRLSVNKALVDDHGADWSIYDKRTGFAAPLQIKVRVPKAFPSKRRIAFSPISDHLKRLPSHFVLLIAMDNVLEQIHRTWLFPATEIEPLCRPSRKGRIPTPSGVAKPADKYSKHVSASLQEVTARLLAYFDTIQVGQHQGAGARYRRLRPLYRSRHALLG
jgi:hypothetical protein